MAMRLERSGLRIGSMAAAGLALGALSGDAAAQDSDEVYGSGRQEGFCLFVSGPACQHSVSIDGVFAYQRSFNTTARDKDFFRLSAEVGYYVRLGRSPVQVGPAFEAGGVFNDVMDGWSVTPKLRFRVWPGHSPVGVELSPGFVLDTQRDRLTGVPLQRMGAHGELGVTIFGAVTAFGAGQWLVSEEAIPAANFIAGARVLLPVAVKILAAIRR
jgi:hypothetical protein